MPIFKVEVGVALSRPPRRDATIYYLLEAENGDLAELWAVQWAYHHRLVSMPVDSVVTDWDDG